MYFEQQSDPWKWVGRVGAAAAIGAVLVGTAEIGITFLPGGNISYTTAADWFDLFQRSPWMGLRNLGLLNILLNTLSLFVYYAMYAVHRDGRQQPLALFALLLAFLGIGVFFATNRAFSMLSLSRQYSTASPDLQRILEAAAVTNLSVGQSHTPGTFLGFGLAEIAGLIMSTVMLLGRKIPARAGIAGLIGFAGLFLFEVISSFSAGLTSWTMGLAMIGGLANFAWYIQIAIFLALPNSTQILKQPD